MSIYELRSTLETEIYKILIQDQFLLRLETFL